ncbi:hypothetical protein OK349_18700 [Sphingomonas sp. BT-65]|uniref:hypothetical protein n=1 Tax=Sphingomonas sp. BT-65 TaxID=2989821 RepID=UPI0022365FF5|nr:hypothetical protein [Sphingomonas sp. BT-65]MCW4463740.1 hypothetical protein [Sphingomonas sp. BT-65]
MSHEATDIIVTWGREFCQAIAEIVPATGQDALEVYDSVFDEDPTLERLRRIGPDQITQLRDAANELFEFDQIEDRHIADAVRNTAWHWAD